MQGERFWRRKVAVKKKCEFWDDEQKVCFAPKCYCMVKARASLRALEADESTKGAA